MLDYTPNLLLTVKGIPPLTQPGTQLIDPVATSIDFLVRTVEGREAISEPFSFDLTMVSDNTQLDLSSLLYQSATLTMTRQFGLAMAQTQIVRHGILADIQLIGREAVSTNVWNRIYKARLVPRLWQFSLQQRSQVFVSKSIKAIVEAILEAGGIPASGFADNINSASPTATAARDMVMQYQESDLAFISRWLEQEGVHYTFQHGTGDLDVDKLVLNDRNDFTAVDQLGVMYYAEDLEAPPGHFYDDRITSLASSQQRIPKRVVLQGYDWKNPASGYLTSVAQVDRSSSGSTNGRGVGDQIEYQARFTDVTEGNRLAQIRAEELFCRETLYTGTSRSPFFRAGGTFVLQNHYDSSLNREYLIVEVTHSAQQPASANDHDGDSWLYQNQFVAVPSDRAFRPQRRTPWPSIKGMISGKIYDEGEDGDSAPVDSYGCYTVQLPFSLMDSSGNLSSVGQDTCRIRMARPYAGTDFGFHFPLHKDTEVTLSFLDGDPDRPVITGALFDGTHSDPVTDHNATQGGIKTKSGSAIGFEDTGDNSKVSISAGSGGAAITVGTLGKSHTGPLTMDNVQIAATKLDVTAGVLSSHSSPIMINNSVLKWMSVTSPLNLLFMIAPLVSKAGQDGKDPVLGITVQPGDQERIDAANAAMFTLYQTMLQLIIANVLAGKAAYAAELTMVTGTPGWTTKAVMYLKEFAKTWLFMPVGGKGGDGISLTATGMLNKVDTTSFGKNLSLFAVGSVKIVSNEDVLGLAQRSVCFVAPKYEFCIGKQINMLAASSDEKGALYLDDEAITTHHGSEVLLIAGMGPIPPLHTSLKLVKKEATLKSHTITLDSWDQASFGAGLGLMKLAQVNLDGRPGTSKVEISSKAKVTVDALTEIKMNAGASAAQLTMGPTGIKLSFGASSIEIGPLGITINGPMVTIEGTKISINGKTLTEVNGGLLSIKPQSIVGIG